MTQFINYQQMDATQKLVFNKTGWADEKFQITEQEFNLMMDEIVLKQEQQIEEEV